MQPILKWAGGKRRLLQRIKKYIDPEVIGDNTFFEPFVGGGSVTFDFVAKNSVINDVNEEIINLYRQIKENPHELVKLLYHHITNHSHDYYYEVRNWDRSRSYKKRTPVGRAARTLYLNNTCYNGLFRVNSNGYFNVPLGKQTHALSIIIQEQRIFQMSEYFNNNNVQILQGNYSKAVQSAKENDVIYMDPPYDYETSVNGFTAYSSEGFSHSDLEQLKAVCDQLIEKGCIVLISNNDTEFVNNLFKDEWYSIEHFEAGRFINCDGKNRKKAREVLIYGKKR